MHVFFKISPRLWPNAWFWCCLSLTLQILPAFFRVAYNSMSFLNFLFYSPFLLWLVVYTTLCIWWIKAHFEAELVIIKLVLLVCFTSLKAWNKSASKVCSCFLWASTLYVQVLKSEHRKVQVHYMCTSITFANLALCKRRLK